MFNEIPRPNCMLPSNDYDSNPLTRPMIVALPADCCDMNGGIEPEVPRLLSLSTRKPFCLNCVYYCHLHSHNNMGITL